MPGLARPVRIEAMSSRATDTAFSIFSSASKRVSSIKMHLPSLALVVPSSVGGDQCSDLLTCDRSRDISIGEEVEHEDRHVVVHAEAERGGVRDLQATIDDLAVRDRGQQLGI